MRESSIRPTESRKLQALIHTTNKTIKKRIEARKLQASMHRADKVKCCHMKKKEENNKKRRRVLLDSTASRPAIKIEILPRKG